MIGDHYVFQNLPNKIQCRCLGFTGYIPAETETMLLQNPDRTLNLESLPDALMENMQNVHLGDNMKYTIKLRAKTGIPGVFHGNVGNRLPPTPSSLAVFQDKLHKVENQSEENEESLSESRVKDERSKASDAELLAAEQETLTSTSEDHMSLKRGPKNPWHR